MTAVMMAVHAYAFGGGGIDGDFTLTAGAQMQDTGFDDGGMGTLSPTDYDIYPVKNLFHNSNSDLVLTLDGATGVGYDYISRITIVGTDWNIDVDSVDATYTDQINDAEWVWDLGSQTSFTEDDEYTVVIYE